MNKTGNIEKLCMQCGKPVKGRADKKFCDDYCRNNYNNEQKSGDENMIRNINNALRKNRKILFSLLKEGEDNAKVSGDKLQSLGFNFKYHTHQYQTQKGNTYNFCYDYGFLLLENNRYLVVKESSKN